jgi:hypothetical protein
VDAPDTDAVFAAVADKYLAEVFGSEYIKGTDDFVRAIPMRIIAQNGTVMQPTGVDTRAVAFRVSVPPFSVIYRS